MKGDADRIGDGDLIRLVDGNAAPFEYAEIAREDERPLQGRRREQALRISGGGI